MSQSSGKVSCTVNCYLVGLVAGAVAAIMLVLLGSFSWSGAIFTGLLLAIAIGVFLSWSICRPLPTYEDVRSRHESTRQPSRTAPPASSSAAATSAAATADRAGAATAGGADGAESSPSVGAPAPAPSAANGGAGAESEPTSGAPAAAPAGASTLEPVQPSAPLPGRSETADGGGATSAPATASAAPADADKPVLLEAPREGGGDDLKMIRGIGPRLEQMLHEMGVFHYDQIAAWSDREVAWVDANLEGFRGRVSRDEWVPQAKILAAGGEAEVARRVGSGELH